MSSPPVVDDVEALLHRARALASRPGRQLLGITGSPGAGKSTLTDLLLASLRRDPPDGLGTDAVGHLPMDGFHLADAQLERLGRRDRKGAPDTFDVDGFVVSLSRLVQDRGRTLFVPGFERELEEPIAAALAIEPSAELILTEGNYLLLNSDGWERVRPLLAEVWFVDLAPDVRRYRLVARHEQFGKAPGEAQEWVDRSDDANARLVEETRDAADLVVRLGPSTT